MTAQEYSNRLADLGWGPPFDAELASLGGGLSPARVLADSGSLVELGGASVELAPLAGSLPVRPTTGDWVAVNSEGVVVATLARRTELLRRAAGGRGRQVVAANVDVFFVVTSANRDFNPRRVERYLAAIWDGGARPVVVLNKIDLIDDPEPLLDALRSVSLGVEVVGASALADEGGGGGRLDVLRGHLGPGVTVGFVGSSGVGKSSLINRLRGDVVSATTEIRADDKGRHTTTRRELTVLEGGGVLIDTPGMREFGLAGDEGGLEQVFADIAALADGCRFRDCGHEGEPGCAVEGAVDAGRLASYLKLRREAAAAQARRDPVAGANVKRRWKGISKQMRNFTKE